LPQRSGNGTLHPGRDLELRERQLFALLGKRARRRRQALAFSKRALERRQPLFEQADALGKRLALGPDALVENSARLLQLGAKAREQSLGGLARLCGRGTRTRFLALYNIDGASRARCAAFLARVERAFARF